MSKKRIHRAIRPNSETYERGQDTSILKNNINQLNTYNSINENVSKDIFHCEFCGSKEAVIHAEDGCGFFKETISHNETELYPDSWVIEKTILLDKLSRVQKDNERLYAKHFELYQNNAISAIDGGIDVPTTVSHNEGENFADKAYEGVMAAFDPLSEPKEGLADVGDEAKRIAAEAEADAIAAAAEADRLAKEAAAKADAEADRLAAEAKADAIAAAAEAERLAIAAAAEADRLAREAADAASSAGTTITEGANTAWDWMTGLAGQDPDSDSYTPPDYTVGETGTNTTTGQTTDGLGGFYL